MIEKVKKKSTKKLCFFVTPIGNEGSPERSRSDRILQYILTPALKSHFDIQRADKISKAGAINRQIFKLLVEADIVVADLTRHNPNVFYELGVRHAFNLPTIIMIDKGERIPFDISMERAIIFDIQDLVSVGEAKDLLRKMSLDLIFGTETYQSPVSIATSKVSEAGPELSSMLQDMYDSIQNIESNVEFSGAFDLSNASTSLSDMAYELKYLKYEIQDLKKKI